MGVRKIMGLIPPLSFVATANSISHLGAVPHFIDIEPKCLGMSPQALQRRLEEIACFKDNELINKNTGRRISAVVPVHIFGLPANIIELKKICTEWKLPLVEDAAEALGSRVEYSKKLIHCGCFGDLGTLSFNGNKIITTGGGGAILTNNKKLASLASIYQLLQRFLILGIFTMIRLLGMIDCLTSMLPWARLKWKKLKKRFKKKVSYTLGIWSTLMISKK